MFDSNEALTGFGDEVIVFLLVVVAVVVIAVSYVVSMFQSSPAPEEASVFEGDYRRLN